MFTCERLRVAYYTTFAPFPRRCGDSAWMPVATATLTLVRRGFFCLTLASAVVAGRPMLSRSASGISTGWTLRSSNVVFCKHGECQSI